jgi:DNA-binding transcriptional regulator YhcF (GntR family)
LADHIEQGLAEGKWNPGERMPSGDYFAEMHSEKPGTVARALYVLAVRGRLALEYHSYYVLPRDMA